MGHILIESIGQADDCRLAGALDLPGSPALDADAEGLLVVERCVLVTEILI